MRVPSSLQSGVGLGALALSCTLAGAAIAAPPTLGPLTVVAAGSIFKTCTADHVASQSGTNFPKTNIEPNIAINPANPNNFLVGIQQDRWSDGGSRGLRAAYSMDGGKSFQASETPNVTQCQNGPWPRSSDPWVTFSPDGTAYFSELVTEVLANPNIFGHNGQTVSQSLDGGVTWFPPTTLIDTPRQPDAKKPQALNDKNSITADPHNSKFVYAVWDKLTSFVPGFGENDERGDEPGATVAAPPANDVGSITRRLRKLAREGRPFGVAPTASGAPAPATFPTFVTGPTLFSRTTNHGYTWEAPKVIFNPGSNFQTIANQIIVLRNGDVLDFFTQQNDLSGADSIGWVRSSDHGATWSRGFQALAMVNTPALLPNLQDDIRSADILYGLGLDEPNNIIYVTWQDTRFTGQNETVLAFSPNGGYFWFGPVRVNQTPRNPAHPLFQQALIPSVTAAADGTVVVTYYDFRNDKVGATKDLADVWAVFCNPFTSPDACLSTEDWATEVRLTDRSFDFDNAPDAGGHFLGDYMGLKAQGQTVWPAFGVSPQPNTTNVLTRSITVPVATAR